MAPKAKAKIVKDVTQLVLARRTRMCNFLEYKGKKHRVLVHSYVIDWVGGDVGAYRMAVSQTQRSFIGDMLRCSSFAGLARATTNS